jgi:glycosyltransferase involved in cell wall biosynthesis
LERDIESAAGELQMADNLMNVMHLISSLEVGGSEKLLIDFLAACRDDDQVNYTVVIMNRAVNPTMRERLERLGLNVYYLDRPEGHKHPKYLIELLKIIHRHNVRIVHSHNFGSKLWAVLCKAFCPGLKLVFTVHDTMSMPRLDKRQIIIHRHWIDQHVAISKTVASLCEKRGIHNYRQIYNGIHVQHFMDTNRQSLQARLEQESFEMKPLKIVHVGRMDYPVKGQDILLHAIKRCKDAGLQVQCALMGGVYPYNQKSFDELKALVQELNLNNDVEFLINRTDVAQVISKADVFVLPSRFEGLGLVILEAMAAGLPVIASNTDGPKELIEDGNNGLLFENGNPDHLFERIQLIYQNPAVADRFRGEALQRIAKFDIQAMKNQYYLLYDSLLSEVSGDTNKAIPNTRQPVVGRLTDEASI